MKFDVKKDGATTVLSIHERKIDTTVSAELKAEFLLLCKPKTMKKLIVDLSEVEFCDSSGLAAFLVASRTIAEHGGMVHLVKPHKKILDLLNLSQLTRIFTINKT